ncbi:Xaa-Pro aminopeptidase [Aliiglaciecola litoralis]|uniref:Xaa-Pro aminopeptidase n=1 Tax=Aliiglaciecola litoralis TaxID=582857 RepID=A0ABP3X217_9ALTE
MFSQFLKQCQVRRQTLTEHLLPNSICIISAAQLVTRSNDTEYPFRQNSDFHYLTGFPEPEAVLILSNSTQFDKAYAALFCQPKDALAEIWQGRRIGPDVAMQQFGFDQCHVIDDLDVGLVSYLDGHDNLYFARGENADIDHHIDEALNVLRNAPKQSKIAPACQIDVREILHEMRLFKSTDELDLIRAAASISCEAHKAAMTYSKAGRNEYHLAAQIHHSFAMQSARNSAYETIVGSGTNACILHYTENNSELVDGDLVLIDAGAEYHGYAADITRTFPVNGRFSDAQAQLYELVLASQTQALAHFKPGGNFAAANATAIEVLTAGLIRLGLLSGDVQTNIDEQQHRQFFMHGLGHWLGLDVHDVGKYKMNGQDRPFEPGMVMTIEPGLYISSEADVDPKWRGIGIRIEDNILITEQGHEVLTQGVPKTIAQIESLMAG